jgi:hypothetical protein
MQSSSIQTRTLTRTETSTTATTKRSTTISRRTLVALIPLTALSGTSPTAALAKKKDDIDDDLLTRDYIEDTKDVTRRVRELLRDGKGDVELYIKKFDRYAEYYKWEHVGHGNSFASLLSLDQIVRKQYAYAGNTPWEVPNADSNKGAMLEAYVRNSESCLVKEQFPTFGEMDQKTRAAWKSIECSQGLVKPVRSQ